MDTTVQKKIRLYADVFKAMGHPTRMAILIGLTKRQCNVNHIVEKLSISQSTVSQHLALLRRTGVVECSKRGLEVCYKVSDPFVLDIIERIIKDNGIDMVDYCC